MMQKPISQKYESLFWPLIILGVSLTWLISYFSHGLFPIDETRYVAVAWEMWHQNSFLIPILNGEHYSHKPPLLFWMIQLGWSLFGVNNWWPRIVPLLFSLGSLGLTARLSQLLMPHASQNKHYAVLILASLWVWNIDTSLLMFDVLLTFFILLAAIGTVTAIQYNQLRGWFIYAIGVACGLLTKGPACFLYMLSFSGLFIFYQNNNRIKLTATLLGYTFLGIGFAAAWPLCIALTGDAADKVFLYHVLWTQTAHRVANSFAHQRPFWWYLPLLPVFLLPWSLMPNTWRIFKNYSSTFKSPTARILCGAMIIPFVIFSCISGKQLHYLIPILPLFSLLLAQQQNYSLSTMKKILSLSLLLIALAQCFIAGSFYYRYDTGSTGRFLAQYDKKQPIGFFSGRYAGEFNFSGRLTQPINSFSRTEIPLWSRSNPNGIIIVSVRTENPSAKQLALYFKPYRGKYLGIWNSQQIIQNPTLADFLVHSGESGSGNDQVD